MTTEQTDKLVERLRERLEAGGLSLREAAPLIGVSFSTLGRIARGQSVSGRTRYKVRNWLSRRIIGRVISDERLTALLSQAREDALEEALGAVAEQRCERETPWDLALLAAMRAIRSLSGKGR